MYSVVCASGSSTTSSSGACAARYWRMISGVIEILLTAPARVHGPRSYLLLGPGRNHAVAARVRDRLSQMLVLIYENVHQRVLLRPVSAEQFHRCLQVAVGESRNRFLQIGVRSLQGFLHLLRRSEEHTSELQ